MPKYGSILLMDHMLSIPCQHFFKSSSRRDTQPSIKSAKIGGEGSSSRSRDVVEVFNFCIVIEGIVETCVSCQISCSWSIFGPESLIDHSLVIGCWGSGISSGARSGARWLEVVGVIISRKRSFLRSSFLVIQKL